MGIRRESFVLLGTALALTACGTSSTFCRSMGCIGAVTVTVDPAVMDRVTAPATVRICLATSCATTRVPADPGAITLTLTGTDFEIDTIDVTVVATAADTQLFSAAHPLTGERINGAGCSPVCFQTSVTVTEDDVSG